MTVVKMHRPTSALLRRMRVGMLVADGNEELEYAHTWDFLERHGAAVTALMVTSASDVVQTYWRTRSDRHRRLELDVCRALPSGFEALVIPGGLSPPNYRRPAEGAIDFLRQFGNRGRMIAAVCLGPGSLIEPGLAQARHLTSWPTLKEELLAAGAYWEDERVIIDGNLITAQRPEDLPEFEEALLEELVRPGRRGCHGWP